ncbi:phosphotransferase [Mycoplasmatota bacterium zrk1]
MIVEFIRNNLYILKDRKAQFLHGDFHLENSVFDENGYIGCYDFNRCKYSDYVIEFERASVFSRSFSLEYVIGLFDGYEFTKDEFIVLRLYLAMGLFNSVVWTYKYYPEQMDDNDSLIEMILEDYDDFKLEVPKYYSKRC